MKIAVYGATGRVGKLVVVEALRRGHEVTALSRHEGEVPPGAVWQHGDLADDATVKAVAESSDAVVTANGPSRVPGEDPFEFATLIAQVAAAVGATRLLVVGGAGSLEAAPGVRLVDTPEFPEPYKNEALATAAALDFLRSSTNVDWTYLSPAPVFPAGEPTGSYAVGTDSPVGDSISGEDFALALLDELETPNHRKQRFTVAAI